MTSQLSILVEVLLENRDCWFALPFVACFVNRVYCQVPEATPRPFPAYSSALSFVQCHRCFKLAESLSQIFSYIDLNIWVAAFATKMRQSFRLKDFYLWTLSVIRLSFSAYCKNAMRRVSLSLCPSFLQMLSSISLCWGLRTTLTMHFFIRVTMWNAWQ